MSGNWAKHGARIHKDLKTYISDEELAKLFERKAWRHFLVTLRLVILTALSVFLAVRYQNPLVWIPAGLLQGFNILGFITLLHEAVHLAIFDKPRRLGHYITGLFYAFPSAISASQFTRWHLDHHIQLGTNDRDPKRAYLTPKIIKRWYKFLYMTPALFPIYAIASTRAAKNYEPALKKKIRNEKIVFYSLHLGILLGLIHLGGFSLLFRVYIFPLFFCFPIAFTINRLGQHYDIDPEEPAKWGTILYGGPVTNLLQVNSNFHLEHHYFPRVPLYNLPALNRKLRPFFDDIGHKPTTYRKLIWMWFVENKIPHTKWRDSQSSKKV